MQFSDYISNGNYNPVSLNELNKSNLLDRYDTKFILSSDVLLDFFKECNQDYDILEVNGLRIFNYKNRYYDTPNFDFFMNHHNKRLNRFKVRKRSYTDSNLNFLEIKYKNNKKKTTKTRLKTNKYKKKFSKRQINFLSENLNINEDLIPTLKVKYNRITLLSKNRKEKITIDFNLMFSKGKIKSSADNLSIVEIKQDRVNRHSTIFNFFKSRGIQPLSISKYCIGVSYIYPDIKQNRFKSKLLSINKIQKQAENGI